MIAGDDLLVVLYMVEFALVFTHEIDSAYWQEWKLLHLPGGIQLFLALHVPLLLIALVGFRALLVGAPAGYVVALVLAGGGVFAAAIHSVFIWRGHREFRLPVSLVLLGLMLVTALPLGYLAAAGLLLGI